MDGEESGYTPSGMWPWPTSVLENYTQNESNFEWHERYVPVIEGSYSNCDFDGRHFAIFFEIIPYLHLPYRQVLRSKHVYEVSHEWLEKSKTSRVYSSKGSNFYFPRAFLRNVHSAHCSKTIFY